MLFFKVLGECVFIIGLLDLDGDIIQLLDVELLFVKVYLEFLEIEEVVLIDVQSEILKILNILLVDDFQVVCKQFLDVFDSKDIFYQVIFNGDEVLQMLFINDELGKLIDILVSDIEMFGLDGYEFIFNVWDNSVLKQFYVILYILLNSEMSLSYVNQVGVNEVLIKFDVEELFQVMLWGVGQVC